MTHPDTLQIPRAVVEQAIEDTRKTAREVFKDSCNHTKDAIEFFAAEFGVQIRAAQPAVVHPIGGRPLESDYVKLTSYIEALEQYVDKKEVLWKAYEDVDCDEYDKLRKAALQPQADTSVLQAAPWPPAGETLTEPEAMRYDFDSYGWKYIDNGSGSDWMTRHPEGEFLFTKPQALQPQATQPKGENHES